MNGWIDKVKKLISATLNRMWCTAVIYWCKRYSIFPMRKGYWIKLYSYLHIYKKRTYLISTRCMQYIHQLITKNLDIKGHNRKGWISTKWCVNLRLSVYLIIQTWHLMHHTNYYHNVQNKTKMYSVDTSKHVFALLQHGFSFFVSTLIKWLFYDLK